ncbi:hypothetical protein Tco_1414105, partial [Tanacetum coccineum]
LRKKSPLEPTDSVNVYFSSLDDDRSVYADVLVDMGYALSLMDLNSMLFFLSQEAYIREELGTSLLFCLDPNEDLLNA